MTVQEVIEYLEQHGFIADEVKDMCIEALVQVEQYRALGTVEELKEAREKQLAKKPIEYEDKYYACPRCEGIVMYKWDEYPTKLKSKKYGLPYCLGCGQKLDWSEEDD